MSRHHFCIFQKYVANGRAETIESAILGFLSDNSLQVKKLCGFGSNGAAVMVGRSTGVAVRLKKHSPNMISVHCVNHKLPLAAAHASNSVPPYAGVTGRVKSDSKMSLTLLKFGP